MAVAVFDRIHTLDSVGLADVLAREATRAGRHLPVLVQVNVSGEAGKRGVAPAEVASLAELVRGCPSLVVDGLMTIASVGVGPAEIRGQFRALRKLRDATQKRLGVELPHLSMGMSDDFEIAVEEGATMLRIGRALFGARGLRPWREGA